MCNSITCPACPHGKGFNCLTCWPAPKRHTLYGRSFVVQAEFPDTDAGTRAANAYMASHPFVGVLAVENGRVVLAAISDKGVPAHTYH